MKHEYRRHFVDLQFSCTDVDRNYDIEVFNTVQSENRTNKIKLDEE